MFYHLRNRQTGDYLNSLYGEDFAFCTPMIGETIGFPIEIIQESEGFVRLRNAQTCEYLYGEEGSDVAKYSLTPPTLKSSQWELIINILY
ncbi:MAG: hypothetical protein EHM28_12145 [Spirochaetaceae bacterium]|nr:MAG: hypothetical protein EHM28_12145 [Spirochaetaceae bacterium]